MNFEESLQGDDRPHCLKAPLQAGSLRSQDGLCLLAGGRDIDFDTKFWQKHKHLLQQLPVNMWQDEAAVDSDVSARSSSTLSLERT